MFFLVFLLVLAFVFLPVFAGSFDIPEIQSLELETSVKIKGVVIVEPGVLGQQIFYLNGAQIYSYYKNFPELAIGDEILAQGVISQSRGERRIKIKTAKDITVLNRGLIVEPALLSGLELDRRGMVGRLVQAEGTIIEKTGAKIFIKNGDDEEILVYFKETAGIDKSKISEGDQAEITGVLSIYDNELRLLPRSDQDIVVLTKEDPVSALENEKESDVVIEKTFSLEKYQPYFVGSSFVLGATFVLLLITRKKV